MNWDQVEDKWKELSGNVRAKWGDPTDNELTEIAGNREALESKIQAKYSKTKEQAKDEVDQLLNDHS